MAEPFEESRLYRYRAWDPVQGRRRSGEHSGPSAYAVRSALAELGLQVEDIQAVRTWRHRLPRVLEPLQQAWMAQLRRRRRRLRADFYDAIATMLTAGLPLNQALAECAQAPSRGAAERRLLQHLHDRIREGISLAQACERFPDWFDAIDIAMLESGQRSGNLAAVLQDLGAYHQNQEQLGQRLIAALAYPCILFLGCIAAVIFLSTVTLPRLTAILHESRLETPALTETVMQIGNALVHGWPLALLLPVLGILALAQLDRRLGATHPLRRAWNLLPTQSLRRKLHMATVAGTLGRLTATGIPLLEAVRISATTAGNRHLRAFLDQAASALERGDAFSSSAAGSQLVEPEMAQLIRLGERSGELPRMLCAIAERNRRAAERAIDALTTVLEPLALVVMAGLIAVVVMAAIQPMVRLGDLL